LVKVLCLLIYMHKRMALSNGTASQTDCQVHVRGSAGKLHSRLAATGVATRGMPDWSQPGHLDMSSGLCARSCHSIEPQSTRVLSLQQQLQQAFWTSRRGMLPLLQHTLHCSTSSAVCMTAVIDNECLCWVQAF